MSETVLENYTQRVEKYHRFRKDLMREEMISNPMRTKFKRYHKENPHVYQQLADVADELISRGVVKTGIALLWERMRWLSVMGVHNEEFKFPNELRTYYAREMAKQNPAYWNLFEFRTLHHGKSGA